MNDRDRPEELVAAHQGLVHSLAAKLFPHAPEGMEFEEVEAYGLQGLVEAANRFDPDKGASFATFAYYRIRGAIIDGFREMGPLIRPKQLAFRAHADEYLEGRSAETRPRTAVDAAQRLAGMVADLATAFLVTSEALEATPDVNTPDQLEVCAQWEQVSTVRKSMTILPEKERKVIELMYFRGLRMSDTAERLGMSKGWVSRLHASALKTLREAHRAPSGPPASATDNAIKV